MSSSDKLEAPVRAPWSPRQRAVVRLVSVVLFVAGVTLGIGLALGGAWADAEAVFYGFDHIGDEPLSSLRCPVLMTSSETAQIRATVANPFDYPIEFLTRADFSNRGVLRSERRMVALVPGEETRLEWTVSEADVDLGMFVFVKAATYPAGTLPFREQTCGIVLLNVPGVTGSVVQAVMLVGAIAGMLGGIILWTRANHPLRDLAQQLSYAMRVLALVVLLAILLMLFGAWFLAALLIVLALVIVIGILFALATQ